MVIAEASSAAIQRLYNRDDQMLVWWGSEIECVSAIARLERDSAMTAESTHESLARLEGLAESWHEVAPLESIRRTARRLLRVHPLRSGDATQLAAAVVAAEGDPATLEFVCLDGQLAQAARREGFPVVSNDLSQSEKGRRRDTIG